MLWKTVIFFAPCFVGYCVGSLFVQSDFLPTPQDFFLVNPFLLILNLMMFPSLWLMVIWMSCAKIIGLVSILFFGVYFILIFFTTRDLKLPFAVITVVQAQVVYFTFAKVSWLGVHALGVTLAVVVALPVVLWVRERFYRLEIEENRAKPEGIELYRYRWFLEDPKVKRCEEYLKFLAELRNR